MDKSQLMESIIARIAGIPVLPVLVLFSLSGLAAGAFMATNPAASIDIQRRFYARINWKIEPISLAKEIRNTRAMGWFLIILSAGTLFFIFTKSTCPFLN